MLSMLKENLDDISSAILLISVTNVGWKYTVLLFSFAHLQLVTAIVSAS